MRLAKCGERALLAKATVDSVIICARNGVLVLLCGPTSVLITTKDPLLAKSRLRRRRKKITEKYRVDRIGFRVWRASRDHIREEWAFLLRMPDLTDELRQT